MFKRAIIVGALCATGCGDTGNDLEELGTLEEAITGGVRVSATDNGLDPFRSVIAFTPHPNEEPDCTATKLSQGTTDKYITAAHCLPGVVVNTPIRYTSARDDFEGNFIETRIRTVFQHPSCRVDSSAGSNCIGASPGSYDVAVFTIDQNSSIPALTGTLGNAETGASQTLRMVGYGCDELTTNDLTKQTALVTSRTQGAGVSNAMHARYVNTVGRPQGCAGDSGGALFQNVTSPNLVGITSFFLERDAATDNDDITAFARTANVRRWVSTPQKLNVIANNEMGFLLNRGQRRCADGSLTGECKGTNQPVDPQYWRLAAITGTSFFQIRNTATSQCIQAGAAADGPIVMATCSSAAQLQHWSLTVATAPSLKIQARLQNPFSQTVRCLAANTSNQLATEPCDMSVATRNWLFYP